MKNKTKTKTKKNVGRPSKLTLKLQEELVERIMAGDYIKTACAFVGIDNSTFHYWMNKADESTRYTKYRRFQDAIIHAQAVSEAWCVAIISRAAEDDWKAAQWMLEHRYTENWGVPPKVKSKTSDNLEPKISDDKIDKDNIIEAMKIIEKKRKTTSSRYDGDTLS